MEHGSYEDFVAIDFLSHLLDQTARALGRAAAYTGSDGFEGTVASS
jgi:hypothetical protein